MLTEHRQLPKVYAECEARGVEARQDDERDGKEDEPDWPEEDLHA